MSTIWSLSSYVCKTLLPSGLAFWSAMWAVQAYGRFCVLTTISCACTRMCNMGHSNEFMPKAAELHVFTSLYHDPTKFLVATRLHSDTRTKRRAETLGIPISSRQLVVALDTGGNWKYADEHRLLRRGDLSHSSSLSTR